MLQHNTSEHYSPHSLLPAPEPRTVEYPEGYFYHNVAKHLIRDTVRIMNNGLHIDLNKVEELETVLADILADVEQKLLHNPLIQEFQSRQYEKLLASYIEDRKSKLRSVQDYIVPFKHKDAVHRSYFMYIYANRQSIDQPTELHPTGIPKWPARTVKKLSKSYPVLQRLLEGKLDDNPKFKAAVDSAPMKKYACKKCKSAMCMCGPKHKK